MISSNAYYNIFATSYLVIKAANIWHSLHLHVLALKMPLCSRQCWTLWAVFTKVAQTLGAVGCRCIVTRYTVSTSAYYIIFQLLLSYHHPQNRIAHLFLSHFPLTNATNSRIYGPTNTSIQHFKFCVFSIASDGDMQWWNCLRNGQHNFASELLL